MEPRLGPAGRRCTVTGRKRVAREVGIPGIKHLLARGLAFDPAQAGEADAAPTASSRRVNEAPAQISGRRETVDSDSRIRLRLTCEAAIAADLRLRLSPERFIAEAKVKQTRGTI